MFIIMTDICGLVTRFGLCYGERIEEQDFIVLRQVGGDVEVFRLFIVYENL